MMMNGDGIDKGKKQKMWRRDILRSDDTNRIKDMVGKMKKLRRNEATNAGHQKKG